MPTTLAAEHSLVDIESRYEFLEKIGSGSFATVYRARDNELGREVAVKRIHEEYMADAAKLEKFWGEAQLLASLQHPNIVTIYDLYRDRGWLILELMQTNLADRMQGRPMDVRAAKTTVAHCLRALKHLHEQGVIHGDVKPSNMMIDARKRIKIGDFGLARRASDEEGSLLKGTTRYMAPEVVSDEFGEIGPASDLYSLGFAAYQLLCGENFEQLFPGLSAFGRNKQVAWMMWHAAPDRRLPEISRVLEGVPEELAAVVDKLVKKPQAERYKTAQEALEDLGVDQKIVRESPTPVSSEDDPGRRKRLLLLSGAMLFSVVLSAFILFQPGPDDNWEDAPDVVVFRETIDEDSIKVGYVDRRGATQIDFAKQPLVVLKEFGKESDILLSELRNGDRLEITREEGRTQIIASRPARTLGTVSQLMPGESKIVLSPKEAGNDLPLRVPTTASIQRNEQPATLADLEVGDLVEVWHLHELKNQPGRVVDRIEFTKAEPDFVGFVESLDANGRMLSVRTDERSPAIALKVAEDAEITLENMGSVSRADLAELKRDDRVVIKRDALVREIVARRDKNSVSGTVKSIEPVTGTFTVQLNDGSTRTFLTTQGGGTPTDIRIGSTTARLEDLRRTDSITVTYKEQVGATTLDARSLTVSRTPRAERWVLVVATSKYSGDVVELPYLLPDARDLAATFRERYGVRDDRCIVLADQTLAGLQRDLENHLKRVGDGAELIVYLGGHAFLGNGGQPVYGPADLDPKDVNGTGLTLSWVVERMEATPAKSKLLLLDTSHAGSDAARQPSTEEQADLVPDRTSTSILASCSRGEQGRASAIDRHGWFAHALDEGYAGAADTDVDHETDTTVDVSPREIERFTRGKLENVPGRQTPVLIPPKR